MKYSNAQFKNKGNDESNLINFFGINQKNLIEPNLGSHSFTSYSEELHEKDIPLNIGEKTRLMLTHPNHQITSFDKSFVNLEIEFEIGFENELKYENFNYETLEYEEEEEEDKNEVNKEDEFNSSNDNPNKNIYNSSDFEEDELDFETQPPPIEIIPEEEEEENDPPVQPPEKPAEKPDKPADEEEEEKPPEQIEKPPEEEEEENDPPVKPDEEEDKPKVVYVKG